VKLTVGDGTSDCYVAESGHFQCCCISASSAIGTTKLGVLGLGVLFNMAVLPKGSHMNTYSF